MAPTSTLPSGENNLNTSSADPPRTLNLQGLAPEVVSNVINHVDQRDTLKNLRLVSKSMDAHARRKMFEQVVLTPGQESITRWKAIADSESLSSLPRHALIQTREDLDEHDQDGVSTDEMGDFHDALNALSRFPRLTSLEVAFTKACAGVDQDSWTEVNESIEHRVEVLGWIFQAIRDRNAVEGASKIRSLTLRNLQNAPIDAFTDSELFSAVMQELHELHIGLIQEYNEHGPDHDYTRIELQTFPAHLCSKWLKPIAPNLRALSLYSAVDNWGCFPGYFDPSAISFPKLETLSLGYYTLTYDDQLDWIFSQCRSLTRLVMHNCMIASILRIDKENMRQWKTSTRNWESRGARRENDWCDVYRYPGTWSQFFDKIADGLPNLKEFCFDHAEVYGGGGWDDDEGPGGYGVENRHVHTGARAFPKRYVVFNNGILPTHWPEAEDDGQLHDYSHGDDLEDEDLNLHVKFLDKDTASLERLLDKCRARREEK